MTKPRPRTRARITVDEVIVEAVQQALAPFGTMLDDMGGELEALRAEWRPSLAAWARHPWAEWSGSYFTANLGPEVAALTEQLAGVESRIAAWRTQVQTLSPRRAWRYGAQLYREAAGIRHAPVSLLLDLHKLRDRVADAERLVARYGPVAPSPRPPAWAVVDSSELRTAPATSRTDFNPLRVGHAS